MLMMLLWDRTPPISSCKIGLRVNWRRKRCRSMCGLGLGCSIRVRRDGWKERVVRQFDSRCHGFLISSTARRLLKSMSIKQGMKYDSPESVRDIPAFIQFHNLKIEELLLPLSEYSNCAPHQCCIFSNKLSFSRNLQPILLPQAKT